MWRQFHDGRVRHWIVSQPGIIGEYTAVCGKTTKWLRSTEPVSGAPANRGNCVECQRRLTPASTVTAALVGLLGNENDDGAAA
jgi:hypothetical protein